MTELEMLKSIKDALEGEIKDKETQLKTLRVERRKIVQKIYNEKQKTKVTDGISKENVS